MVDKPTLIARITAALPDNANEEISAADLRTLLNDNIADQTTQEDLDLKPNIAAGIAENTVLRMGSSNTLVASSLTEDPTCLSSDKDVNIPNAGKLTFQNIDVVELGGNVFVFNRLLSTWFLIGSRPLTAEGSGRFIVEAAGARQVIPQTPRFDLELTQTELAINFRAGFTVFLDGVTFRTKLTDTANNGKFYVQIHIGTDATGPVLWRSHRLFELAAGGGFDMTSPTGNGTIFFDSTENPLPFIANMDVYLRFISVDGNPFTVLGTEILQEDIDNPFLGWPTKALGDNAAWVDTRGWIFQQEALTTDAEARGQGIDAVLNGTHMGVTVGATGTGINRVLNLTVDPSATAPEITTFSLQGQATSVDAGTVLTGTRVFNYSVMNPSNISGNLTIAQDGVNLATDVDPKGSTRTLTITEETLAAGDTTVFSISGAIAGGGTVSREVTITGRGPDEFVYHGLSTTNNSAGVLVTTLEKTLVTGTGQQVSFSSGVTSAGEYVHILVPNDHDITALINVELGHDVLPQFTKASGAQTLSGQVYNGYILGPVNAGFTQQYRATLA